MHQNNIWLAAPALVLIFISCIKRYDPEIPGTETVKFVVSGQVVKGEDIQYLNISKTSALNELQYNYYVPVSGCMVRIEDDNGNSYPVRDVKNGNYESVISEDKIHPGTSFKVQILTPDGIQIVSDFDQLQECPEVDSVYYMVEQLPSTDPYWKIKGIRFYCDLDAINSDCRHYRYEAHETWKYKAIFANIENLKVCWRTNVVRDIFTLSTKSLTENRYKLFPLHFVDNYSSQRLLYGYSLLLKQYSLSEAAYDYWEKIRINSFDQGGLYTKQPLQIRGNMHNVTYPEQQVLGFFGASAVKTKRIYVQNIKGMVSEFKDCEPPASPGPSPPPEPTCFNCLLEGGTNVKPDFWPN